VRSHPLPGANRPPVRRLYTFAGWLLTFNFVALGWVWFALPGPSVSLHVFGALAGLH
jgi:D-alanyl-lipoteichoic acid acyltransferase DltB (MBOAT superfamily)